MAKMVNFGLAYGMSDFGLSSRAGISRQDAQEFINSYFAAYGGISRYMLHIRETAREQGYVATLLGRKRRIPELEARNPSLRAAGERMAINMPIQGTAADIVKIAMIRMDAALREGAFRSRVLLSVHDELLLEAPRDEVDRLIPVLRETMEGALPLSVPLTVEVEGRRFVGGHDARSRDGTRSWPRPARRPRRSGSSAGCPSCPRSRPSPGTCVATCSRRAAPGPTITGARVGWLRTLRDEDPARFEAGVTGRRIEAIGRRGKQLIIDLSGGAYLTIHLKMTGQLFVVPAALPIDPYERLALALDDGRELRFRDIRKFGRVGLYGADDDPFDQVGPEPLDPRFTLREFRTRIRGRRARLKPLLVDQAFIAGVGNIYADEALWRSRLHPLRSARSLRPADERALYRNVVGVLARGRRAAGLLDRRLHGARRRRRDAGAARRLPAHGPAVPPLRAPDPADRHRHPGHPLLLVVSAPARRRAARPRRPCWRR